MNRNLSNAIEKSNVLEQEVLRFMDSKDQLVSEAYDGLRNRYEILHLPIIKGFKTCFQAQIDANMKYELEIVGTLRMTYVNEAAIRQELVWMRLRIHELEQRVQAPGEFIYIGYLSVYERIRNELEKKISQIEAFLSQTNGIYDGIDIYQSYIQQGIVCLGSVLSDPTIETVPAVLNLAWAKALQEITPEEVKDLKEVSEVAGKKKWIPSTIHKILSNEKYIGDALLQKTITTNLLEKKREINNGLAPQYYVEDSHEAIIPRDLFMRVQEEMVRRANLRSGEDGKKKRIYSSKYALSSLCTCEKCGDIYRRIAWNNRGKHSTVWRCCTRVEHGPGECDAPTIQETDLQAAVMKAINKVVGQKSTVIENLETILEQTVICADEELAALDEKIKAVQLELVNRATSSEGYEDLARESDRLNEEKQKIQVKLAEDKGRQEKKAELITFLHEQTTEFEEFDDGLVRKLIEQITVHGSGTFTVEFKSGTMVEV